jgi:hypothetical protein
MDTSVTLPHTFQMFVPSHPGPMCLLIIVAMVTQSDTGGRPDQSDYAYGYTLQSEHECQFLPSIKAYPTLISEVGSKLLGTPIPNYTPVRIRFGEFGASISLPCNGIKPIGSSRREYSSLTSWPI